MNPPHTYRNEYGIFYFRRVLPKGNKFRRTEIRFSLHTRDASEARIRAYKAWLVADTMIMNGHVDAFAIRAKIQSTAHLDGTNKLSNSSSYRFGPELLRLTDVIGSWDTTLLQAVINRVSDDGGEIFAPFKGDECTFLPIREHGRPYDEEYENFLRTPLDIADFAPLEIVLTASGIKSASSSVNGNFEINEFYSYYPGKRNSNGEFIQRITPSRPLSLMVSQLMVSDEIAANLQIPYQTPSNVTAT